MDKNTEPTPTGVTKPKIACAVCGTTTEEHSKTCYKYWINQKIEEKKENK